MARRAQLAIAALIATLIAVPVVYLVARVHGGSASVTAVVWSEQTGLAIVRSVGLAIAAALIALAISVPLAWLTHATDLPGRRFWRVILNLPLAVPSYVGAFVVVALLAPGGLFAGALEFVGVSSIYGGLGAALALSFTYPLALLPLQASLARTDPRLWESARSLGLTPWRAFVRVILPSMRAAMTTGALLTGLYAIGDFGAVSLMRFRSLSYLIYVRYKSLFYRDEAAILALVLVAVAVTLVVALRISRGRVARSLSSTGSTRQWPTVELGGWKWPSFGFCVVVASAGVGIPLLVVATWLVRGLRLGNDVEIPWQAISHSTQLGLIAGAVLVFLALAPALLFRYGGARSRSAGLLGPIASIGYALPGIVVALAVVTLAASHLPMVYQTLFLLCAAYVVRFLPLALETIDEAIGSHNRSLYLAARSLGAGPLSACVRVVIPNAKPALAAAFLAVFVAVIKELPLTLLLSPPGYETLATNIWMLTEDAYFAAASAAAFAMLLIASAVLMLSPRRGGTLRSAR